MGEALPHFRYHPDPVATGSVEKSPVACVCCKRARGYIYVGPVYSEGEHDREICPWCIADGTAHSQLDAQFVDLAGVGGYAPRNKVDRSIAEEVAYRTPGFCGWQQERWLTCCGDAAMFLGRAGYSDVIVHGSEAVETLRTDLDWDDGKQWQHYLKALSRDGQPTAYLFRCSHCGRVAGYSDFT
jgi:uncharacterized protein CbrC (UPF0167 family)